MEFRPARIVIRAGSAFTLAFLALAVWHARAPAGGTYSQGTCQPGGSPLTAQKMCEAHGGTYFAGGDYCEVGGAGWKP